MQINFKKINKKDVVFTAVVILLIAAFLLLPSAAGKQGTSPGQSAMNAIIVVSKCTDEIYEKYNADVALGIINSLRLDKDFSGIKFWTDFIHRKYGI